MKRTFKKLLYSFFIFLLVMSSLPLQLVNASVEQMTENHDVEELIDNLQINKTDDKAYQSEKLDMIKEFVKENGIEPESDSESSTYSIFGGGIIENDFLSIAVGSNGRFTMGTTGGNPDIDTDDNKILLYGHPHPSLALHKCSLIIL